MDAGLQARGGQVVRTMPSPAVDLAPLQPRSQARSRLRGPRYCYLGLTLTAVSRLAVRIGYCEARRRHRPASTWIPAALEVEEPPSRRPELRGYPDPNFAQVSTFKMSCPRYRPNVSGAQPTLLTNSTEKLALMKTQ